VDLISDIKIPSVSVNYHQQNYLYVHICECIKKIADNTKYKQDKLLTRYDINVR